MQAVCVSSEDNIAESATEAIAVKCGLYSSCAVCSEVVQMCTCVCNR